MKKVFFIIAMVLLPFLSIPCTTFIFQPANGNIYFGRNFDFPSGAGMVNINQREVVKQAFVQPPEKEFRWQSVYGSISFNQIGREFPYGGMNETGLVIEQMWLNETQYPEMDERHGLTELQWIQYQLDVSATVQDVINSDTLVRISPQSVATLHFLVADAAGNKAVVEYLNGKMKVYTETGLPHPVLANCPYERSLDYMNHQETGDEKSFSGWTQNSSGRFATVAKMIDNNQQQEPVDFAWSVLDSVSQDGSTQWSIVYGITDRSIFVKTRLNPMVRKIELASFCFSAGCSEKHQADIHSSLNPAKDFTAFSFESNLAVLNEVCNQVDFLGNNMPQQARNATAGFAGEILKMNAQ